MKKSFIIILIFILPIFLFSENRVGKKVMYPENAKKIERSYSYIINEPQINFLPKGEINVEFETKEPTPPAIVYYGLNTLKEDVVYPRFRSYSTENYEGVKKEHFAVLKIPTAESNLKGLEIEPCIRYRIEVYIPSFKSSRFFDGQVYYNPKNHSQTVNIIEGPIVDMINKESVIISFKTDTTCNGVVKIDSEIVARDSSKTKHEIKVIGLKPNTKYTYSVSADSTESREYSFKTAGSDNFKFAAYCDSREGVGGGLMNFAGSNFSSLSKLSNIAYRDGAEFIVFCGDLVNGYTASVKDFELQLRAYKQAVAGITHLIPIYEGMGNHESLVDILIDKEGKNIFIDKAGENSTEVIFSNEFVNPTNGPINDIEGSPTYKENVYYFDYGPARLIMLNNSYWWVSKSEIYGGCPTGMILKNQLNWFKKVLEEADKSTDIKFIFVSAHCPAFPNDGH